MGYPDKLSITIPGEAGPAEDIRDVVIFIVNNLRKRYFEDAGKPNDLLAPIPMTEALHDMKFPPGDVACLLAMLQRTMVASRASAKEDNTFLYFVWRDGDIKARFPLEHFEGAWRMVLKDALNVELLRKAQLRLDKVAGKSQAAAPAVDEKFLAEIERRVTRITKEREEAVTAHKQSDTELARLRRRLAELEAQVTDLQEANARLEAQPQVSNEDKLTAFLAHIDELAGSPAPRRRRASSTKTS